MSTNLVHPTLLYLANQNSPWASFTRIGSALLSAPKMIWAESQDRRLFNEMLFSHYAGMSDDRLTILSEEVFETVLESRIYPGAMELIEKCKVAGQRVVLITGSLDITIAPLARHFGIDPADCITNRLEMKDHRATGKLLRPVVAGPTKARLVSEDAKAHGHDLADCFAYSDSYSDVPLLSVVGHPYCVHPDAKLTRLASAYHWPTLSLERGARHGASS